MSASPFAERLAVELQPILRSIRRVLAPPPPFDPATSRREFRVAFPDLTMSLFPLLVSRVRREAPSVLMEWIARDAHALPALSEERIDIGLYPSAMALPEGLDRQEVGTLQWATFARRDHPAAAAWGRKAWLRWPHVAVRVGVQLQNPVERAAGRLARRRRIVAWVPHFSSVAQMLSQSDLLATLPAVVMHDALERFGLRALPVPFPIEPMPHRLVWSQRLGSDPGLRWLRAHAEQVLRTALKASGVTTGAR